jgi:hypothetical protein
VSFLDAAHGFEEGHYEAMWDRTSANVTSLMSVPPDDPRLYRRAAFVLPGEHATRLALEPLR